MRILLVAHYLPPNGQGGVENYTVNLARSLAREGHAVTLYARGTRRDVPEGQDEISTRFGEGIDVIESHPGRAPLMTQDRLRLIQGERFTGLLGKIKPEVVHFQHLLYHSLDYIPRARQAGATTVLTLHDFWWHCPTVRRVDFRGVLCDRAPGQGCLPCLWGGRKATIIPKSALAMISQVPVLDRLLGLEPVTDELEAWQDNSRLCLSQADALISPSHFLKETLAAYDLPIERLTVLENGIPRPDESARESALAARRQKSGDASLRFGIIGMDPLKGAKVAVDAFRKLTDPPVRLYLFGADAYPDAPGNLEICGRYTLDEIERVFATFDVLIVPSLWYENAPLVIREAFARRIPVIASDIGGMKESVRDGVDGLHFPVGNADALADCVRRLSADGALRERLRAGIRTPVFEAEHVAALTDLYERLRNDRATWMEPGK